MSYLVPSGLYAVGRPTSADPVVVTANYKMSFDMVRSELAGRNVWLLVLETFGINVWCAAGKGTFGTEELVRQVEITGLAKIVSHRRLLLPILGAPGIAAHQVTRLTGFTIAYATIRASDLPRYLDNGQLTTPDMRQLTFSFRERLALIPVEVVNGLKPTAVIIFCLIILGYLLDGPGAGLRAGIAYLGATLAGLVAGPLLLPWLPGRAFSTKGAVAGLVWSVCWYLTAGGSQWSWSVTAAAFTALPAVSAFYTLNFTGCSTYTSRTGVKREMRRALPVMGGAIALSLLLVVVGRFI
jgi:acetyl-CoA decarbonylase/synthase complex subunit gamma